MCPLYACMQESFAVPHKGIIIERLLEFVVNLEKWVGTKSEATILCQLL